MKNLNINKLLIDLKTHIFIIFITSLYFTISWFPGNKIWGGADVGIPFYNTTNQLGFVSSSWWETHATGVTSPMTYTAVPFYVFFSILEKIGITPSQMQSFFTFIILFGGAISIYFLFLHFFPKKKLYALAASIFYLANFMSLTVWHRGVHNGMLMLILIPLSLLILIKGIRSGSFRSIIVINLVSFAFSYVYGAPGYIFTIWLVWFVYLAFEFFIHKEKRKFVFIYLILLISSWILFNSWWLVHFIISGRYTLGILDSGEIQSKTVEVLVALKVQTGIAHILRGISWFDLYSRKDWGEFYSMPVIIFLSWVPAFVIFSTSISKKFRQNKLWCFAFILTLGAIFISKGANPPFGWLNKFFYDKLPFLAPLRNPYEKVGIVLGLSYSLLFALGLYQIADLTRRNLKKTGSFVAIIIFIGTVSLVWPMWLGKIFFVSGYNYLIDVPDYYKQASEWLKENNDDTRTLHLPLAPGESVDYEWGYTGGVPSQVFFSGSSLAYSMGIESVDFRLKDLIYLIHKKDTLNIEKSLASFNVGWIVVHNETEWKRRGLESVEEINNWLNTKPDFLEHKKDFGRLSVWKVSDSFRGKHVYSANPPIAYLTKGISQNLAYLWSKFDKESQAFITLSKGQLKEIDSKFWDFGVAYPSRSIKYSNLVKKESRYAVDELPHVRHLPDKKIYPLVVLKEGIEYRLGKSEKAVMCLDIAGKRLVETYQLKNAGEQDLALNNLDLYTNRLKECQPFIKNLYDKFGSEDKNDLTNLIDSQLLNNYSLLVNEFNQDPYLDKYTKAKSELFELFYLTDNLPKYYDSNLIQVLTTAYEYNLAFEDNYGFNLNLPKTNIVQDDIQLAKINNLKVLKPLESIDQNHYKYGPTILKPRLNEYHLIYESENIFKIDKITNITDLSIEDEDGITIITIESSKDAANKLSYPLGYVTNEINYKISFEYFILRGSPPVLRVVQDSDYTDHKGKLAPQLEVEFSESDYEHYWKKEGYVYKPTTNAKNAALEILVTPWNNCEKIYNKKDCQDELLSSKFAPPSVVSVRNLTIEPVFNVDPVLISTDNQSIDWGKAEIKYEKVDKTNYLLNITSQKLPYLMVFSETYNPSWKLFNQEGAEINLEHFQANGYANAWLVEEQLPEEVYLRFELEKYRRIGILITLGSVIVLVPGLLKFDKTQVKKERLDS